MSRDYDDRDDDDVGISRGRREDIPNYLTQAILVTLCCCWPFGIPAIVQAAKVNTFIAQGDYARAREASDSAKKWSTIAFVLGLIVIAINIVAQVFLAMNNPGVRRF
jgi:hypothetical protein